MKRAGRILVRAIVVAVFLWSVASLWMELMSIGLRLVILGTYLAASLLIFWRAKGFPRAVLWTVLNGVVIVWFFVVSPPAAEDWLPEYSRMPWSEQAGDNITIHDIRNFSYRTETDVIPKWENLTININEIIGADLFLTHWGLPLVAHSMVSFRLSNGSFLATSIEARRSAGQQFSALRGFFRQYQVAYLISEERDVVRVRTNYRQSEEVYLYRTRLKPADARGLFEAYLRLMNSARQQPEWYNALTRNCSSPLVSYLAKADIGGVSRWDWRGVLDGSGDKMLYELGDLQGDYLPFFRLKEQALINPVAKRSGDAPDFSKTIRLGRAGF